MNQNFKIWLENRDKDFYDYIIQEDLLPSWLKNVFVAGSIALASLLYSGEGSAKEFQSTSVVKQINEKRGKITIEVKIPLKISRMDLAADSIKSSIKSDLLKFLQSQDRERLDSGVNFSINLMPEVLVDVEDRSDVNPLLTKFDLRELLPGWKSVDQEKLNRLLNVFIKPNELEKKKGFHTLKLTVYYEKTFVKAPENSEKPKKNMQPKKAENNVQDKKNPTQSNLVK